VPIGLQRFQEQYAALSERHHSIVNANQRVPNFQPDIDIYGTEGRIVGIDCTRPFREGELRVLTQAGEQITKHSSKDAVVRSIRAFNDAVRDDREPTRRASTVCPAPN